MNYRAFTIWLLLSSLLFLPAKATHIVGGEFTYIYLGDSTSGGITFNKYQMSLSIYEDCLHGNPVAIEAIFVYTQAHLVFVERNAAGGAVAKVYISEFTTYNMSGFRR